MSRFRSRLRRLRRRERSGPAMSRVKKILLYTTLVFTLVLTGYVIYLDFQIRSQFEGKRWSVPAYVFARPLELHPNKKLTRKELLYELDRLRYHLVEKLEKPGTYSYTDTTVEIYTRAFVHGDEEEIKNEKGKPSNEVKARHIRITMANEAISDIQDVTSREELTIFRLDPVVIAKIYPSHNEDRILVQLKNVPDMLIKVLKATEDRSFDSHWGISLRGIARALWRGARGESQEGGSTLTQQLVKNYFLSREKKLSRKVNEMIMAMLLEAHYKKTEILEAYLNEVYFGQDGRRAVHGFGLASQHFFGRPLQELELHQMALLVGMLKAPTSSNPRSNRENALFRRNVVINILRDLKIVSEEQALAAKNKGLDVVTKAEQGLTEYPAFLDLLRRQLRRDFRDEDLTTGGLRIFTTLDPIIQYHAEKSIEKQLAEQERALSMKPGTMQVALVVTNPNDGDVLAIVGDRNPRYPGFNRALDAKRHIGSLVKPAVYLTALESGKTLASLLDDSEFHYKSAGGGAVWSPKNYDKEHHGMVPFYLSLAHSYNITTARLGLEIGMDQVVNMLHRLGIEQKIDPYPSLLLGAIQLPPVEVTQMYQTFASGGLKPKLKSIKAVMNAEGKHLQSYPLKLEKIVDAGSVYLLNVAMQASITVGTGRGLQAFVSRDLNIAGKTGTTDEMRDSWFAGFSGNYLSVVWIGRDDNQPIGLSGSSGALKVWGEMVSRIKPMALRLEPPNLSDRKFEFQWTDPKSGLVTGKICAGAVQLPFVVGTAPKEQSGCGMLPQWLNFNRSTDEE